MSARDLPVIDVKILEDWDSPKWRINNIYTILDAEGKKIPFRMNEEQENLFDSMWYWNIILKARQMGFSTAIDIFALDQCLFVPNFRAGIIAQTEPDVLKLFQNKILKPYLELPLDLRESIGLEAKNATQLKFGNGSSLQVGMSMRSDTLQFLHVSEFGKICAKFPERAREIVTGAFETLAVGNPLFVESTAEGNEGYFHDYCIEALHKRDAAEPLSKLDFKLHFYPWFQKAKNRLDPDGVVIPPAFAKYFDKLHAEQGIVVDPAQKAWYVKKAQTLKGDMRREHPSYPKEAFEASIDGAYYEKEMLWLRTNGRITDVPWRAELPVNTFWDFGVSHNNETTIWMHQRNGLADCFVRYYEAEGEGLAHFVNYLNGLGYTWGTHYLPHDGATRMQGEQAETREEILNRLGIKNTVIVPRVSDINNGIELTRQRFTSVWIDRTECIDGIKALDNYVRDWDDRLGQYKKIPLHNWASNGADSFRQWGQGYRAVAPKPKTKPGKRNWRVL